jgi:hypothetical protein
VSVVSAPGGDTKEASRQHIRRLRSLYNRIK